MKTKATTREAALTKAAELGTRSVDAGIKAPVHDRECMDLIREDNGATGIEIMKEWHRTRQTECLRQADIKLEAIRKAEEAEAAEGKAEELLTNLAHFTGSETIYHAPLFKRNCYTEGMKYLADEAGAHWLLTAVASHHVTRKQPLPYFLIWRLEYHEATEKTDAHWKLTAREDTNEPALVTQKIEYSDFPITDGFEFYDIQIDETRRLSMLKSEY